MAQYPIDSEDDDQEDKLVSPVQPEKTDDEDKSDSSSDMDPDLKAYLTKLSQAQNQANQNQFLSSLARAGSQLAQGISGATQRPDQGIYDALDKQASAPVTTLVNQQQQKTAFETAQAKQVENQRQEELSDPDSSQSKAVQSMIGRLYPGRFTQDQLSQVSASDAQDVIFKPLELDEKIRSASALRQQAYAQKNGTLQDKAYTDLRQRLESFRGNQAAQQASRDVLSADKTLAMVANKDPNTLTTQDLTLLAGEMSKIATGGVPTEHGVQALMPNGLQQKFAEMQSFLSNKPTDAQAGEYIKKNMAYLKEMKDVAQGSLNTYRSNILKGYKNRVRPEDYQEAMSDYGLNSQPAQTQAPSQQFGQDVLDYAQKHGIAPAQAQQIKDQRTGRG